MNQQEWQDYWWPEEEKEPYDLNAWFFLGDLGKSFILYLPAALALTLGSTYLIRAGATAFSATWAQLVFLAFRTLTMIFVDFWALMALARFYRFPANGLPFTGCRLWGLLWFDDWYPHGEIALEFVVLALFEFYFSYEILLTYAGVEVWTPGLSFRFLAEACLAQALFRFFLVRGTCRNCFTATLIALAKGFWKRKLLWAP